MSEQVTSEVRLHKAPENFLGIIGQVYFVDYYNAITKAEETIGTIYPDGTFSPPKLKQIIKEKENEKGNEAVITPVNAQLLSIAKKANTSTNR